jgi:hypothetical protein
MRRLSLALVALALAALAAVALVVVTGGFTVPLGPALLRVHNPLRLEVLAALLGIGYVIAGRAWLVADLQRAHVAARRRARAIAIVLSLAATGLAVAGGSFVAGGPDSYGYVSQADRWLAGNVEAPEPAAARVPLPDVDWVFSPLGYRPALRPHHTVPTYPPGLPWMMALAKALAGAGAVFYVVPLFAGWLVWLTFRLGAAFDSEVVGLAAATLLLTNATFLFQSLSPMSDVPAAALWCAAVLAVWRGTPASLMAGGLASGLALAVRPNLFVLAVVVAVWILVSAEDWRRGLRSACLYAGAAAPAVCAVLVVNWRLYGHPLLSGYGNADGLYAWANVLPNLRRYPQWLIETQGVAGLAWIAMGLPLGFASSRARRGFAVAFVLALWAAYLPYIVFDDWTFLRFLLPAMPIMAILAIVVWRDLLGRWLPAWLAGALVLVGCIVTACYQLEFVRRGPISTLREHELRYVSAAAAIPDTEPAGVVCLAMLHSGSLRYYKGCLTARYDLLPERRLCESLEILRAAGLRPYIVLDEQELDQFRRRFALPASTDAWPWPRIPTTAPVTIFDARQSNARCD